MSKYGIEIHKIFEPFVYEDKTGIKQVYKVNSYQCPEDTIDVLQWGDVQWTSMRDMFMDCEEITTFSATDTPDLSQCDNMSYMFKDAYNFNGYIGNWDVSHVKDMSGMFFDAGNFNQDISNWDVSNVENMDEMFFRAISFTQNISKWNVKNLACCFNMFDGCYLRENIMFQPKKEGTRIGMENK